MAGGFCPKCGKPRTGERFCANCGNDFWRSVDQAPTQPVPIPTATTPDSARNSGISRFAVIIGVLALLGLGLGAWIAVAKPFSGPPAAGASGSPTSTSRRTPTAAPTPEHGTGVITFGTALDPDTLLITKPATTFRESAKIAWSASLLEPAGATSIEWVISKVSGSGAETVIYHDNIAVSDPKFDLFANTVALGPILDGPGDYVMRYYRGATKLAEGTFTLTK
jgi:hypothetical protein